MTEADGAPRPGGGPLRTRGVPPTFAVAPSLSAGAPPQPAGLAPLTAGSGSDRPDPTFLHQARSPLPHLAASVLGVALAFGAVRWSQAAETSRAPGDLWRHTVSVLAPVENPISGGIELRNQVAVAVSVAAALVVLGWVGRLGRNVRRGGFGFFLGLAALPAWYTLPIIIGQEDAVDATYGVFVLRTALALLVLVLQYGLVRATLLRRVWSAGSLPQPAASIALWLPAVVPLAMVLGSRLFTLLAVGEDGRGTSAWVPTDAMVDVALWADRVTNIAIVALLVLVSIAQHQGIRADRAADQAYRSR